MVFFALWYGSSFGIGAVLDLAVEVIAARTMLAVVLCLHPEGVETITVDRFSTMKPGAHCAYRQPVNARALEMGRIKYVGNTLDRSIRIRRNGNARTTADKA